MNLLTFEPQPNFPKDDLTDVNAAFLEIMLANSATVQTLHLPAERSQPLYESLHQAASAHDTYFPDDEAHRAFLHGMSLYEITAGFIQQTPARFFETSGRSKLSTQLTSSHARDYLADAKFSLTDEAPRFARVIESAASRTVGRNLAEYALMGVGMERAIELTTPITSTDTTKDLTEEFYDTLQ